MNDSKNKNKARQKQQKTNSNTDEFLMNPNVDSCFHLWEDGHYLKYSDKLEIHILELPKLGKFSQVESDLMGWAQFINAEKKEVFEMLAATDPYLKKAYDRLINISADEEKRVEYEARQKAIRNYKSQVRSNWEDGHEEGK